MSTTRTVTARAAEARGELTLEQEQRRAELNAKWKTLYDVPGRTMSNDEFGEMQTLNAIHARRPSPVPVAKAAVKPVRKESKSMNGVKDAVAEAVAREISALRQERELQAAKIDAALARVDAALARAEGGRAERGLPNPNRELTGRMMVTR